MSNGDSKQIRSPSYPVLSLGDAVAGVGKIEAQYRANAVERVSAAKLLGYSSLSGPAAKALAALASYGLVASSGKGEIRVTERARAILHAQSPEERSNNLYDAAVEPPLYRQLMERFEGIVPPEDGVITHLNRQGFNPTAVRPAAKAFLHTMSYLQERGVMDSPGDGRAGVVKFPESGGQRVAPDTTEPRMSMNEYGSEPNLSAAPISHAAVIFEEGEVEWMRNKVGGSTNVRLLVNGEMGPKEIGKLIKILEAQKSVLEDD